MVSRCLYCWFSKWTSKMNGEVGKEAALSHLLSHPTPNFQNTTPHPPLFFSITSPFPLHIPPLFRHPQSSFLPCTMYPTQNLLISSPCSLSLWRPVNDRRWEMSRRMNAKRWRNIEWGRLQKMRERDKNSQSTNLWQKDEGFSDINRSVSLMQGKARLTISRSLSC